jgi:hypothetical protein
MNISPGLIGRGVKHNSHLDLIPSSSTRENKHPFLHYFYVVVHN